MPPKRLDPKASTAKRALFECADHWKYMLGLLKDNALEDGDYEKLETAVKQTYEWIRKNKFAKKDEFEAKDKELMELGEAVMDRMNPPPWTAEVEASHQQFLAAAAALDGWPAVEAPPPSPASLP